MFKKVLNLVAISTLFTITFSSSSFAAGDAEAGQAKSVVCGACHGPQGISSIPLNANLAGQVPGYIETQLKAFKSGERKNIIMSGQAVLLSEEDMADLDAYYSSLTAATTSNLTEEDKTLALSLIHI